VKFVDGVWEIASGGPVPVKDGTEAELRVPAGAITDPSFLRQVTQQGTIPILPIGTPELWLTLGDGG
jgi:hypothetical protein